MSKQFSQPFIHDIVRQLSNVVRLLSEKKEQQNLHSQKEYQPMTKIIKQELFSHPNERSQCENSKSAKKNNRTKYASYTYEFKKNIVDQVKELHQINQIPLSKIIRTKARQYQIHPKNITRWYNTEDLHEKRGSRKAMFPEMQLQLSQYVEKNPSATRRTIIQKAQKILKELYPNHPDMESFRFSKGWYERFRDRYNLRKDRKYEQSQQLSKELSAEQDQESKVMIKRQEEFEEKENLYFVQKEQKESQHHRKLQKENRKQNKQSQS